MHREGFAHSIEAWQDGHLVGGLYGLSLGSVFFGECMFTRVRDAAKAAFVVFARHFFCRMGGTMIDSQVYTDHSSRFGGGNISRAAYLRKLSDCSSCPSPADLVERRGLWNPAMLDEGVQAPGGVNL